MALKYLALLVLCVVKVNCMALKGPPLTRYDPCGLGVIHFDRLMTNYWQSVLHLGLYKNLLEVEIEIYFEKKVTIFGVSHNSSVLSLGEHGFRIQPRGPVPQQFKFYMILEGLGENEPDVPTVTKFTLNNVTLCSADIKKNQTVESLDVTKKDEKHHKHICGRRSLDHTELVSVRTEAKAGDWPWHVAIFIKDLASNTMSYYCGGNIISKTAIVTAGHCVIKDGQRVTADRIVVVAGTNNHKEVGQIGRQSLPVKEVVLHPNYDGQATSDVAILKVDRFKYTAYVQPICVWGPVYDKQNLIGRHATVVGFGHDVDNNPSDVLRAAYIMVQNDTTCVDYSPSIYKDLLNEFTFCAGYGPTSGNNPRNGDSGGGLVVPVMQLDHKVSWFLRGVLSKCGVAPGHTECDPRYYVVYTDVGPHYGWIYHHSGLVFGTNVLSDHA
ncbi:clotting factor B-like isoform X1 [Ostrinia nubilalis]|uniref:clotting factor B-like isoform X1 n=1 Tax=Ostrinia nubilalis TaxID=29057 RepID=UPI0030825A5E